LIFFLFFSPIIITIAIIYDIIIILIFFIFYKIVIAIIIYIIIVIIILGVKFWKLYPTVRISLLLDNVFHKPPAVTYYMYSWEYIVQKSYN
jgi:hypothetical protein